MKFKVLWDHENGCPIVNGQVAKRIGSGSDRVVYRFGKYVIKINFYQYYSPDQNLREWQAWKKLTKRDRKYFAKLYQTGWIKVNDTKSRYTIQQYIDRKSKRKLPYQEARKVANKYGVRDLCRENVICGKIVDFGFNEESYWKC